MPSWNWDESATESGVVHESVANTDHDNAGDLKQGYSVSSPYLSANLMAYWPLHEDSGSTAYDFGGSNYDGTINGATVGQAGLLGTSSYSFDATDDWVDCGTGIVSDVNSTTSLSVSAWVKLTDTADDHVIVGNDQSVGSAFGLRYDTGESAWRFTISDGNDVYVSHIPSTANEWVHLVGVWDGSEVTVYENGVQGTSTSVSSIDLSNQAMGIGAAGDSSLAPRYWSGSIADVRFYDTALSQSDVQTLYDVVNTVGTWTSTTKTI